MTKSTRWLIAFVVSACLSATCIGLPEVISKVRPPTSDKTVNELGVTGTGVSDYKAVIIAWSKVISSNQRARIPSSTASDPLNYEVEVKSTKKEWVIVFHPTERAMDKFNNDNGFHQGPLLEMHHYVDKATGVITKSTIP